MIGSHSERDGPVTVTLSGMESLSARERPSFEIPARFDVHKDKATASGIISGGKR
jgi:hypothetical protein